MADRLTTAPGGPRGGHAAMLAFSALVAGSFPLGAMVGPHIDPAALNAVRLSIAAGVLLGLARGLAGGVRRRHLAAPWRFPLMGGAYAAYFVCMFEALKTALPVATAAIFTLTPAMSAGFGWLLMRQVTTPRMALALAIGAVGALWVIFRGDPAAVLAFDIGRGEAIFLAGCVAHAIFTPLLRLWNRGEPPLVSSCLVTAGGASVLLVWGWPALAATDWAALPPVVWVALAYTTLAASVATTLLLQIATLRLPSAKVMAYTYLVPSWVICWEFALGRGLPPALVWPGVGVSVLALALLLKDEERRAPADQSRIAEIRRP